MTDLRIVRATSAVTRGTDDDQWMAARGSRDGSMFTADWVLAHCLEGRAFVANAGTATTPITFGSTGLDTTEFDLHVAVPANTTIIPIELAVQVETWGTVYLAEIVAGSGSGSVTGAGTTVTPKNLRSDAPNTSNCTITSAATGTSGTAFTTNYVEWFRAGYTKAVTQTTAAGFGGGTVPMGFKWSYMDRGYAPIVVGTSQIGVWVSCQAATGFITLVYIEVPSNAIV